MQRTYKGGFRQLIAWQEAKKLTLKIYKLTENFPDKEKFNLISQLQKAASSAMANLAEGSAMKTREHRNKYYNDARGSVVEVDNFIELSFELHYISEEEYIDLCDHAARLTYLITKLRESGSVS